MIEVVTVNGYKRLIHSKYIVTVGELSEGGRSNTVITLNTGETIFVANSYSDVKALISE